MVRGDMAVIFLDGEYGDPGWYGQLVDQADIVLAADGGAGFLVGLGARPDAVVGDFDSLDPETADRLAATGVELVRHPIRKDVTDGELAVEEALRRGAGEVVLVGATGALDHSLGHLAILRRLARRGIPARLAAPDLSVVVLIGPAAADLDAPPGTRVSVVALSEGTRVSETGLVYPLDRYPVSVDVCLGLGNAVLPGEGARVTVHEGSAAVLVAWGWERFGWPPGRAGE